MARHIMHTNPGKKSRIMGLVESWTAENSEMAEGKPCETVRFWWTPVAFSIFSYC